MKVSQNQLEQNETSTHIIKKFVEQIIDVTKLSEGNDILAKEVKKIAEQLSAKADDSNDKLNKFCIK